MIVVNPKEVSVAHFHQLLLGSVVPRPIAFVSTVDKQDRVNLSPFSFFNVFSASPPILVFSPAKRVRDNTTKHTLDNVREVPEVVINIVNHAIVEQMSLASTEYEKNVNEFMKAGLTEIRSVMVNPPRVAESPISFECKVRKIIELGKEGGAGNLVICEVLLAHFHDDIFGADELIDPRKLDAVARLGKDWYCRASGDSIFELAKPVKNKGIGVDNIPHSIRYSKILTGNNLGRLGNIERLPSDDDIKAFSQEEEIKKIMASLGMEKKKLEEAIHKLAQKYLDEGKIENAWKTLLQI
jgi:flavin reductase (DIM6/NTAB) family NADH-FMN oxidoreductase RutF